MCVHVVKYKFSEPEYQLKVSWSYRIVASVHHSVQWNWNQVYCYEESTSRNVTGQAIR